MRTLNTQKIPVTVLTGFLGAGKTTLLNRIMTEKHGKRIAIIQNEFGEIGIDGAIVINADEEIFEMNNGCICCTVRGDLIRILDNLKKRRHKFDYVLIETDGLADPAPVAQTFFVDPDMQEFWKLDGIVTVIDAKHLETHWETNDEVKEQIAFADVILINKIDLVTRSDLARIEKKIRSINAVAKITRTQKSELPIQDVLDIGAFDLNRILTVKPQFLEPEVPFEWSGTYELDKKEYVLSLSSGPDQSMDLVILRSEDQSELGNFKTRETAVVTFSSNEFRKVKSGDSISAGEQLYEIDTNTPIQIKFQVDKAGKYVFFTQHLPEEYNLRVLCNSNEIQPETSVIHNAEHEHDEEISSVSIEFIGDLDEQKLNLWMSILLKEKGADIYRMKGIVAIKGQPNRFVFHGVHMLFDGIPDQPWGARQRINQMVFIGKKLDQTELNDGLRGCLA